MTALIDGVEHSAALAEALDRVGRDRGPQAGAGQLVLVSGWWLGLARGRLEVTAGGPIGSRLGIPGARLLDGDPYCLDPWPDPAGEPHRDPADVGTSLLEVLKAKARAGVDVRVLGWVSPALRRPALARRLGAAHIAAINALTMRSIEELRAEPAIGGRALPNLVGHAAGSTHSKVFLVCDGADTVAFTGGLDLEISRWSRHDHAGRQSWHDVVARIEGPAVQSVYDHFKTMWDANLARLPQTLRLEGRPVRSVLPDTPPLPARRLPARQAAGTQTVTGLETLPAARYRPFTWMPKSRPFPAAPQGRFTYRDALKAAISRAQHYVYIEDQLFWSREVMDWLNAALRARPELQVVLVLSGADDPNDAPLPHDAYLCQAVNHHLLRGLSGERVRLYRRVGLTVHAKTVVVDDARASIGSCNIGARSLYTDVEHGIAIEDPEWVRDYRTRLWAHHLGGDTPELADWADAEKASGGRLARLELPLPEVPYSARLERRYRGIHDPDSRRPWGGVVPDGAV